MKRIKHRAILAVFLSIYMSLSTIAIAFAQDVTASNSSEFEKALYDNLVDREISFTITYTGNLSDFAANYNTYVNNVLNINDYLGLSYQSINPTTSGSNGNYIIKYTVSYWTSKEQETYIDQQVATIVSQVTNNTMTNYEKIFALQQYILDNTAYDNTLARHSAYNALSEKLAVCQGYAMLFDKLLEKAGIQSTIITGTLDGGGHAWNLVNLDGTWYHVDATNDDVIYNKFFLKSDATMRNNKFSWVASKYVAVANDYVLPSSATVTPTPTPTANTTPTPTPTDTSDIQNEPWYKYYNLAVTYEENAEIYSKLSYLDKAQIYLNKVSACDEKTALQTKIDNARVSITDIVNQKAIDTATASVVKLETKLTTSNLKQTKKYIALLPEGTTKTDLTNRVNIAVEQMNVKVATDYVVKLENYLSTRYLSQAQKYVALLAEGTSKTELTGRIDAAIIAIDNKAIDTATAYVVKFETYQTTYYLKQAQKSVALLEEGTTKSELTNRINDALEQMNITTATAYVAKAERYKTITYINKAQKFVAALSDSDAKTALQERLNIISN